MHTWKCHFLKNQFNDWHLQLITYSLTAILMIHTFIEWSRVELLHVQFYQFFGTLQFGDGYNYRYDSRKRKFWKQPMDSFNSKSINYVFIWNHLFFSPKCYTSIHYRWKNNIEAFLPCVLEGHVFHLSMTMHTR